MRSRPAALASLALLVALPARAQNTPQVLWTVQAHGQSVAAVDFAADGQTVASAADSDESTAKLWSAANGALLASHSATPGNLKQVAVATGGGPVALGQVVGFHLARLSAEGRAQGR